jgi:very-short-patch-repair endonuclease
MKRKPSKGEEKINQLLKCLKVKFEREYQAIPGRRFRFDFAIPDLKIAIEYEGGTWDGGGHVRGKGYSSDCQKYSLAAIYGWCVIRVTADLMRADLKRIGESGVELIELAICMKKGDNETGE